MNELKVFTIALAASLFAAAGISAQDTVGSQSELSGGKVSGIDQSLFSDSVAPGDNFYVYANEKWLEQTPIPSDKSNYGVFTILDDETRNQVRDLIEQAAAENAAPGSAAQKVGDLYRSVINLDARNEAGIAPIAELLDVVAGIEEPSDVAGVLGKLSRAAVDSPIGGYVNVDARDSENYALYMTQSGLTMPDRDYYLEDDERYQQLRGQLKDYIAATLSQIDVPDPEAAAQRVLDLETEIARYQWTKTENRDPVKTYNKRSSGEMEEMLGSFSWDTYADEIGLAPGTDVVVRQPSYFEAFAAIHADTSVQQWKDYLAFHVIDAYAASLSEADERRHFGFHSTALQGVAEQEPMWKRGVNVTGSVLGEMVGQLYTDKYFKPAAKARMDQLVDNVKRAFKMRIETRDWMGEGTKKQALEKLSMFTTKIGYPDKWKDYSELLIESPVLATNMIAAAEFMHDDQLGKLGEPIDRTEWHMTPQTINAYYNPVMNEIVFPAAILQPPFFNVAADDAVNYGGIGAVIGHELSHGFDDKGSKFDGNGNLRMWWTPEDREKFEARAAGLVGQYDTYEPVRGNFVNGKLTLGENIGDLGGLNVAYAAYRLSLDDQEAPVIDGLTGDQRFFLGWSQIWRRLYREPELLRRLITDPHSPSEYRVNGIVRNMDQWYDAFGIETDDELYLKPDDRVRIW